MTKGADANDILHGKGEHALRDYLDLSRHIFNDTGNELSRDDAHADESQPEVPHGVGVDIEQRLLELMDRGLRDDEVRVEIGRDDIDGRYRTRSGQMGG